MVVAEDVGDSVGRDDGSQSPGHELSGLGFRKLEPDRAAGPRRTQPPLARRHSRQVRAKPPGFDDVGNHAAEISGDKVVRVDQVARDLSLDINPNAARTGRLPPFDFASDPDPDDIVFGMGPEHPAGMAALRACAGEQLLYCRALGAGQFFRDLAASHHLPNLRARLVW